MHLLQRGDNGGLTLTEDLADDDIPKRYAILSHTWIHGDEVTFDDFMGDAGKEKARIQEDPLLWRAGCSRRPTILLGGHLLY